MKDRALGRLAWMLGAVGAVAIVGAFSRSVIVEPTIAEKLDSVWILAWLGFPLAGAVLAAHRPRTRIGWIMLAIGALTAAGSIIGALIEEAAAGPGVIDLRTATLLDALAPGVAAFALIPIVLMLFPEDRIASRRMRIVAKLAVGLLLLAEILWAVRPIQQLDAETFVDNPIGVDVPFIDQAIEFSGTLLGVIALIAVVNLFIRFRRSRDEQRQQMKWFAYASVILPVAFVISAALEEVSLLVSNVIFMIGFVGGLNGLAAAIVIAVLKYRLYDIDVVISKTVVFAGLAAFITSIYVGIVVGVGTLLGAGGEPNLALSIVATAVVAVAFQPVRERLTRLANRLVFGKRATPYEVLSRFSSHLGETLATEDTLQRMARLLADGTGAAHAQVSLAIGGQMIPAASVGQVADASAEAHTVEVTHQGEALGSLSVTKKRGETLTPADVKLVDDLAAQAGLLLRNVRLTEELKAKIVDLRASRQRLVAAQDAERRRLERDLHDGAQQQIVAMKLKLGIAKTLAQREGAPETVELVEQLAAETDEAVQTLRELAHGIYPPLLAAEGLEAAISTAARRAPVPVTVETDGIGRYDQDIEAAVYFCVLEAITNAAKYADPNHVTVTLAQTDEHLGFEVVDDGHGFDPDTTARGHGLTNMTDRLDALGGQLEVLSVPGTGTTVAGELPAATIGANA